MRAEEFFAELFSRASLRVRQILLLHAALWGLWLGTGAAALALFADRLYPFLSLRWPLFLMPALGGTAGLFAGWLIPVRKRDLALFLDRKLGLEERLVTVQGVLGKTEKTPLEQALLSQASAMLQFKPVSRLFFLPWRLHARPALASLGFLALTLLAPLPTLPWQRDLLLIEKIRPQLSSVEERAAVLSRSARREGNPELASTLFKLQLLAREIRKRRALKKQDVLVKLSQLEDELTRQRAAVKNQQQAGLARAESLLREAREVSFRGGEKGQNLRGQASRGTGNQFQPVSLHQRKGKGLKQPAGADWGMGTTHAETTRHPEARPRRMTADRQSPEKSRWKNRYEARYGEKRTRIPKAPAEIQGKWGPGTGIYPLPGTQISREGKPIPEEKAMEPSGREPSLSSGRGGHVEAQSIPPSYEPAVRAYFQRREEP